MVEVIDCENNSGETIKTYIYKPTDIDHKLKLLIFSHGFCVNHTYFEEYAKYLSKHGYCCITFDFRGGGEDNLSSRNLYNTSVLTEIEDLNTIIDYALSLDYIDQDNIYLVGHSQGGFVSSIVAANRSNTIKSLFLLAPAFLIPEEMNQKEAPPEGVLADNIAGVVSRKYVLDARTIDVYEEISKYKKNIYLFHGLKDRAVDITYIYKAIDVCSNTKLYTLENQTHNFKDDAQLYVMNIILELLGDNIVKELDCSYNNEKIYTKLYLPKDSSKKYPLVILSHGLSLNHTTLIEYGQLLVEKQIAVVLYDFRGGGYNSLSDGKISDMSLLTEMDDLNTVINMVKSIDCIDNNRIYLSGHSQGGLISSLVASNRDDIKSLFLFAPAYVIADDVVNINHMRKKNVLRLMPEYLGDTYTEVVKSIDIYNEIKEFTNPVYIYHGLKDRRVPIDYIYRAIEVYPDSKLTVFDDQEHRFSYDAKKIIVDKINSIIKAK
ncbi:MAG: alpha/beta fold hydrolase [Methanosphaera sp.]|nr:alpha/beta fold hydrolase [Methanosphaera sp.]